MLGRFGGKNAYRFGLTRGFESERRAPSSDAGANEFAGRSAVLARWTVEPAPDGSGWTGELPTVAVIATVRAAASGVRRRMEGALHPRMDSLEPSDFGAALAVDVREHPLFGVRVSTASNCVDHDWLLKINLTELDEIVRRIPLT